MRTLLAVFAAALPLACHPVAAQTPDHAMVVQFPCWAEGAPEELVTEQAMEPKFQGVGTSGVLVTLWANTEGAFWISITKPDGSSCGMVQGDGLLPVAPKIGPTS